MPHTGLPPAAALALALTLPAPHAHAQCGVSDLDAGEPVTLFLDNDYCTNFDAIDISTGLHCGFYVESERATGTLVDEDFFLRWVLPGETLRVAVDFDGSLADVDLYLHDFHLHDLCNDLGTNLAESEGAGNHEEVEWTNGNSRPVTAILRIRVDVASAGSQDCAPYSIRVWSSQGEQGVSYCGEGSANSAGPGAVLASEATGTPGVTRFEACGLPDTPGILYYGPDAIAVPFGCGTRCVGGAITRLGVTVAQGGALLREEAVPAGMRVQYWYRDPDHLAGCGSAFNLSNAVSLP